MHATETCLCGAEIHMTGFTSEGSKLVEALTEFRRVHEQCRGKIRVKTKGLSADETAEIIRSARKGVGVTFVEEPIGARISLLEKEFRETAQTLRDAVDDVNLRVSNLEKDVGNEMSAIFNRRVEDLKTQINQRVAELEKTYDRQRDVYDNRIGVALNRITALADRVAKLEGSS